MSDKLSPKQQEELRYLAEAVTREIVGGKHPESLIKKMIKQGWSEEAAREFVVPIWRAVYEIKQSPEWKRALAEKHKKRMTRGLLLAVAGIVITGLTYSCASEGGYYMICWGAILFGLIDFAVGLVNWLRYR